MKHAFIFLIATIFHTYAFGQEETKSSPFTINGYIETYYSYDFNQPEHNTRPGFVYAYNRHNEVNLNLGFIRGSYQTDNVRANLALMAGTYANANLAAEPGVLKNIYEANVGIKLSSSRTFGLTRVYSRRILVLRVLSGRTVGI